MPNQRVAAEALGRIGDPAVIPAIFAALSRPTDQVLDHSLTYALIEIDQPEPTAKGLSSDDPRVRRSAMIALDQMENGKIEAAVVAAKPVGIRCLVRHRRLDRGPAYGMGVGSSRDIPQTHRRPGAWRGGNERPSFATCASGEIDGDRGISGGFGDR